MRQIILQGLEQVYSKLFHMIAEFLPRFLAAHHCPPACSSLLVCSTSPHSRLRGFWPHCSICVSKQSLAPRARSSFSIASSFHERAALCSILGHLACFLLVAQRPSIPAFGTAPVPLLPELFVAIPAHFWAAVAQFPIPPRFLRSCRPSFRKNSWLVDPLCNLDSRHHHDPGRTRLGPANRHFRLFNSFRCHHAGLGHRFRLGRSGSRPQSAGAILRRRQKG